MPLYLSASSINDFLVCSKRFHYRTTQPEEALPTDDMLVGTIVHYAIEKYWNSDSKGKQEVEDQLEFYKLPATKVGKARTCIENFYEKFQGMLDETDEVEYKFKLPLEKDVFLVGKMDRISNGNIFDWKTSSVAPKDISTDIQFLIYQEAYTRLFGKIPRGVFYASLTSGGLVKLAPSIALTKTLFGFIIPVMIREIRAKEYSPTGIYTKQCRTCSYQKICYNEYGLGE